MERVALDADELRTALAPRWAPVEVVEQTGSTNADLLARPDAADRSVLVAEYQSAGRGRLERNWQSPPRAGLTFSVLLRPEPPIASWGWLPLLTGVALRDALADVAAVAVVLKWPNDVLDTTSGRKLAGVLAQTSAGAVVIGVGLNVTTTAEELPIETATSLAECGAQVLDRARLLSAVLQRMDARVAQWTEADGDAEACGLATAYRDGCTTIGREVEVTVTTSAERGLAAMRIIGTAIGVDADGRLRVRTAAGDEVVGAGDVRHVRPG